MEKEVVERLLINQLTIMTILAELMEDREKNEHRDAALRSSMAQTVLLTEKVKGKKDFSKILKELLEED